jgi:hypothetical protein
MTRCLCQFRHVYIERYMVRWMTEYRKLVYHTHMFHFNKPNEAHFSWKANSYSADEETPSISGNQKLINCLHNCPFFRVGSTISIPTLRKNITTASILRVNELVPVAVDQHPLASLKLYTFRIYEPP